MPATIFPILVPLDGSKFAEEALPLAISIARATGRYLRLCHVRLLPLRPEEVASEDTLDAMCRLLDTEGDAYLREVQRRLQGPGLRVDLAILPGDIVSAGESLAQHVQDQPVDMVVLSTHGHGGVRRAWLGSVADYLMRHLEVPLIMVRPGMQPPGGSQRILVPLDGSAFGEEALDQACALAEALDREIVLLRVIPPAIRSVVGNEVPYIGIDQDLTASSRVMAQAYLDAIEERVKAQGIRCSCMTMLGASVAECILDLTRPGHYGLIVMSSHGRGGLKRLLLGSIADKVCRGAEVPVMIVHPCLVHPNGQPARETKQTTLSPTPVGA